MKYMKIYIMIEEKERKEEQIVINISIDDLVLFTTDTLDEREI
jgi:hypothetical protein